METGSLRDVNVEAAKFIEKIKVYLKPLEVNQQIEFVSNLLDSLDDMYDKIWDLEMEDLEDE